MERSSDVMTAQEVAAYLAISYCAVLRAVKRDEVPHRRIGRGRGRVLFSRDAIDRWLACSNSVPPEPPGPPAAQAGLVRRATH